MYIKWLKNKLGEKFYPITHSSSVLVGNNNETLETKLNELQNTLDDQQAAIDKTKVEISNFSDKTLTSGGYLLDETLLSNFFGAGNYIFEVDSSINGRIQFFCVKIENGTRTNVASPTFQIGVGHNIFSIEATDKFNLVACYTNSSTGGTFTNLKFYTDEVGRFVMDVAKDVKEVEKQVTTNLLKPTLGTVTQNGVTCTNNGDGTYTLNGTSTDPINIIVGTGETEIGATYKLIGCPQGGTWTPKVGYKLYTYQNDSFYVDAGNGSEISSISEKLTIQIQVNSGVTCDNLIFKPMLTTNLSATYEDFVKYTGDTGSLNSDVADVVSKVEIVEEDTKSIDSQIITNLLKPTLETTTVNELTITRNIDSNGNFDGTYTLNGTPTADTFIMFQESELPIGKYKILGYPNSGEGIFNSKGIFIKNPDSGITLAFDYGDGEIFEIESKINFAFFLVCASGITCDNVLIKPMLTTNLSATYEDFVKYTGDTGILNSDVAEIIQELSNGLNKKFDFVTWNATIKGVTWSRLCYVPCHVSVEGCKYIINISATRDNVVYNDTFLVTTHHPTSGNIVKLAGSRYSYGYHVRVLGDFAGNSYFEIYDTSYGATSSTTQIVHVRLIPIFCGNIEQYTDFTSGETIPDDFYVVHDMTLNNTDIQTQSCDIETIYENGQTLADKYAAKNEVTTNLFKPTLKTTTMNGVTCTNNGDGTYTINGTATAYTMFRLNYFGDTPKRPIILTGKEKLVGCPAGGSTYNSYRLIITPIDEASDSIFDIGSGVLTRGLDLTKEYGVRIDILSGVTVSNVVFKPMITTNLNATYDDFVSFTGTTGKLNSDMAEIKSESEILAEIIDRTYQGTDLTVKFASEIANYSDEWAWIKARITAGNFSGIHVCDYIPITCTNGYVLNAQVSGINTYKGYGDTEVGNHIDFICKELWNDLHVMNKVNYNNGNANSPSPFLASDLNYWLNSMSGTVPNSTSDPSVTTEVDYTSDGVLYYLPDKLKNQIMTKRILLPNRYTAGQVLTNDNSWAWQSTGKLWIPSEVEVYGAPCWGNSGYGMGGFVQYPLFACNMNRAKLRCASKDRCNWWLLSANAGNSTYFAVVGADGGCGSGASATTTWVAAPVCFRI